PHRRPWWPRLHHGVHRRGRPAGAHQGRRVERISRHTAMREDPDGLPSSSVRLRRRLCSLSDIYYGLVSPRANMREDPDGLPSSSVRLRRRLCSLSDIYYGLVSPRDAWWLRDKVMAGETPANPAMLEKPSLS